MLDLFDRGDQFTQDFDLLGPLLAGIGLFPFIPDQLGRKLKKMAANRGMGGSNVPLYHGTPHKFRGLPEPRMDDALDDVVARATSDEQEKWWDLLTEPGEFRIGSDSVYHSLDPELAHFFSKPYGKITEEATDLSNHGYAPWDLKGKMSGPYHKREIFENMLDEGRSGVILDPMWYLKDREIPTYSGTPIEDFVPQVVTWNPNTRRTPIGEFIDKEDFKTRMMRQVDRVLTDRARRGEVLPEGVDPSDFSTLREFIEDTPSFESVRDLLDAEDYTKSPYLPSGYFNPTHPMNKPFAYRNIPRFRYKQYAEELVSSLLDT